MNCSTPGLPVHHQLLEFTQTHVHWVGDAIQAISSSVIPFSSCPQSLPASESFPMSQLCAWGGQSTRHSALASFLPKNTQDWSPLEWTGWISLQFRCKRISHLGNRSENNVQNKLQRNKRKGKRRKLHRRLIMNTVKSLKRCIIGSSEEAERKMRLKNNWKDYNYGIFKAGKRDQATDSGSIRKPRRNKHQESYWGATRRLLAWTLVKDSVPKSQ